MENISISVNMTTNTVRKKRMRITYYLKKRITHIFLCCHCCAEILHLSECWGSHLHHPPRLKTNKKRVLQKRKYKHLDTQPFLWGPTESHPGHIHDLT